MLRRLAIGLTASLMLAAGASTSHAQVGTAFTYQGQLKKAGTAVATLTDMQFSLWTAPTGGTQVGSTITQTNVAVTSGLFTSSLDFGVSPYTADQERWLQISFRNPAGTGSYVPMATRQRLTAAPFSLATRGLNVAANGNVGIGTANPGSMLEVVTPGGFNGISHRTPDGTSDVTTYVDVNGGWIGTTNNKPLLLFAGNNFESMVVYPNGVGISGGKTFWIDGPLGNGDRLVMPLSGNLGIGIVSPLIKVDVASGSTIGTSAFSGANLHDPANQGVKVGFGYQAPSGCSPGNFNGMQVAVNPGTNGCGNSVDMLFFTEECNTSCPREVMRINGRGNVGIGTAAPMVGFLLHVNGSIRCSGLTQTSAREFKQDIVPLTSGLEAIMKLRPVSYIWNEKAPEQSQGMHDIGFIADEVEQVLPDIVAKDETGKPVGIDYGKITPVAVDAIKQLKAENDQFRARLEKIEALLAAQAAAK
jgi:hypothetical protein